MTVRRRPPLAPYLYVAPCLLFLIAFTVWPTLYSFFLSFHRWDFLAARRPFVGLENYRALLASGEFWNAARVTALFVLLSVPGRLLLALAVAALLRRETPLNRLARAAAFLPVVSSTVAIAVTWSWLFQTDAGPINRLIEGVGGSGVSWLQKPGPALWAVVIVTTWKQLGYDVVVYTAGLQAIPAEYAEAARVDGAHAWAIFWRLTWPLLMPTTFFLLVVSVIDGFQVFTLVSVMTGGGPALGTDVVVNLLYRLGFVYFDIGRASALAILLFILLLGLTLLQLRVLGRRVHYEGGA